MNSENLFSSSNDRKENLPLNKNSPVEFTLSYDQYVILQHSLPKKYALLEYKPGKRNPTGSAVKPVQEDVFSLLSVESELLQTVGKLWEYRVTRGQIQAAQTQESRPLFGEWTSTEDTQTGNFRQV